jgi:hypothetical protein
MRPLLAGLSIFAACAGPSPSESREAIDASSPLVAERGRDAGIDAGAPPGACVAPGVADPSVAFKFNPGPREIRQGSLYVVYSGMKSLTDPSFYESSNIYLIKGHTSAGSTDVFIFGAGYSDPNGDVLAMRVTMDALRSGAADAADADQVIRSCMALDPGQVNLRFIAPHWHVDHINQAFLGGLLARGYDVARLTIQTHLNDHAKAFCGAGCRGAASVPPFTDAVKASAVTVGSAADACNTVVATFETPDFGTWSVVATPGHTSGTLSLDNAVLRARFLGGGTLDACPLPQGFVTAPIHRAVSPL